MPSRLSQIHQDAIARVPPGSMVVGVSIGSFVAEVTEGFSKYCEYIEQNDVEVTTSFDELSVLIKLIAPSLTVVVVRPFQLQITFEGELQFIRKGTNEIYRKRPLAVTGLAFNIEADPYAKAGVSFFSENYQESIKVQRPNSDPDPILIKKYYDDDVGQYRADESAIAGGVTDSVMMGLEKFLRFPGIKSALQHFKLGKDLEVAKEFPEYILLYGKPKLESSVCPYVPRTGVLPAPAPAPAPASASAIADNQLPLVVSACGETASDSDPQFFIIYPASTTIIELANEKQSAALSVGFDDYAYSTIHYWVYDIAAILKKCSLIIDTVTPSLALATEWKLVGGGVIGAIAGCTRIKLPLEKGVLTNSMFYLTLKIEPCLDDKGIYLKTSYTTHHHHVEWNSLLLQATLKGPVTNAANGAFGKSVFTKIADPMQVSLITAEGWGNPSNDSNDKSAVRAWSQDVRSDSLLIALTLSRD